MSAISPKKSPQAFVGVVDDLGDFKITFEDHIKSAFNRIFPAHHCLGWVGFDAAVYNDFLHFIGLDAGKCARDDFCGGTDRCHGLSYPASILSCA
jgi:hypothetical protein